jgi:hypothetical protein
MNPHVASIVKLLLGVCCIDLCMDRSRASRHALPHTHRMPSDMPSDANGLSGQLSGLTRLSNRDNGLNTSYRRGGSTAFVPAWDRSDIAGRSVTSTFVHWLQLRSSWICRESNPNIHRCSESEPDNPLKIEVRKSTVLHVILCQ